MIRLSEQIPAGYAEVPPVWRRAWARLRGQNGNGARTAIRMIYVFDELDKIDGETETVQAADAVAARPGIDDILRSLKTLFAASGLSFVFVAGKDLTTTGSRTSSAATASTRAFSPMTSICLVCGCRCTKSAIRRSTWCHFGGRLRARMPGVLVREQDHVLGMPGSICAALRMRPRHTGSSSSTCPSGAGNSATDYPRAE